MLSLFRNNSPFTVIILLIFAILAKLSALLHPVLPLPVPQHFLYNGILKMLYFVFKDAAFAYSLLALVLVFIQSLYMNGIVARHKLFNRHTYIPAFVYLLLGSVYPTFNGFNETIFVNWFLLAAMDTMFSFTQTQQPRKLIYNAGFFFCMAAMFQFTLLSFFLLLLVGMVMFRPINLGEWTVAMMGYLTPIYFVGCLLFLTDRLNIVRYWAHIGFSVAKDLPSTGFIIFSVSGMVILLTSGVYAMQENVAMSNIYVRRDYAAVSFYLIIALVAAFITDSAVKGAWLLIIPPVSIIISHAVQLDKNKGFRNFISYFLLFYLLICLFINK